MIVKVEHLLFFVVILLICYNLFSSCGCGIANGFSVGGQLDSVTDIKIPVCCHNLWNKLPDDIKELRGINSAQLCRDKFMDYLTEDPEFARKNGQYDGYDAGNERRESKGKGAS